MSTSLWPTQTAIVVSDSGYFHNLVKELLRKRGWTVNTLVRTSEEALTAFYDRRGDLFILDDSPTFYAPLVVRTLMTDPGTILCPKISFLTHRYQEDAKFYKQMGDVEVIKKPIIPEGFLPNFIDYLKLWETKAFIQLRNISYAMISGKKKEAFTELEKVNHRETEKLTALSLTEFYRGEKNFKKGEKTILSFLKKHPRDLGGILSLANLYSHAASPHLAIKLLSGVKKFLDHTPLLLPDFLMAELLMGENKKVIDVIKSIRESGFFLDEILRIEAIMYYTLGLIPLAEKTSEKNREVFLRMQKAWGDFTIPIKKVG